MSQLPRSSKYRATPNAPVTDAEREQLTTRLNAAFEAGAVSNDDYPRLLDALFAARTLGDLVEVVEALPPMPTYHVPAVVAVGDGRPGELLPSRPVGRSAILWGAAAGVGILALVLLVLLVLL